MKRFNLLLFFCCCFSLAVWAEDSQDVTVSGYVNDADGNPIENAEVTLSAYVSGSLYTNTVYTNVGGYYTDMITYPDTAYYGWINATTTACGNYDLYGSGSWTQDSIDVIINFDCPGPNDFNCGVSIIDTAGIFYAWAYGNYNLTYIWSTGDTTDFIIPTGNGNYCVTVTDSYGCMADTCLVFDSLQNCSVNLYIDNFEDEIYSNVYGASPITYAWSSGETTPSIAVISSGTYCLTITDGNGCESTACTYFANQDCLVSISVDNNQTTLTANPTGIGPFFYSWNTGATTQSIPLGPNGGTYWVNVTDSLGCYAYANYYYNPPNPDSLCAVTIQEVLNGSCIEAIGSGTAPFTYQWNTGSTNNTVCMDTIPYYCVTVTDATGCMVDTCIYNDTLQFCSVNLFVDNFEDEIYSNV